MITREFPPESGGIGYYVYNLSKKLLERGHKVTVITRGSMFQTKKEIVEGIDVFKVTFLPVYPLHILIHSVFVNMIFKKLELDFDIVHIHSPVPPPIKTSLPTIITVHTFSKTDAKFHEVFDFYSLSEKIQAMIVYPPIEARLIDISDYITTVSLSVANELKEYGLQTSNVEVIGNGVNEKVFTPRNTFKVNKKYVLYTGILRARKGLFDLLDSAQIVCREFPDVHFLVSGTGSFFQKLQEKVLRKKMEHHFRLLGYVKRNKLIELYQNATVHVTPSHYEGLPTVLLEAMSCGLPAVATNVGGNKQVISNGTNGFLVPPKDPKALARTIIHLLKNDDLRVRVGKAARKTVEERYTWDRITDNIIKCYTFTKKRSKKNQISTKERFT